MVAKGVEQLHIDPAREDRDVERGRAGQIEPGDRIADHAGQMRITHVDAQSVVRTPGDRGAAPAQDPRRPHVDRDRPGVIGVEAHPPDPGAGGDAELAGDARPGTWPSLSD